MLRFLSQWYQLECTGNEPGRPVTDQPTQMTMDSTHRLVPLPDARIVRTLRDDAPLPAGTRWVEVKYLQRWGRFHRLHCRAFDSVRYLQGLQLVCKAEGLQGLWALSAGCIDTSQRSGDYLLISVALSGTIVQSMKTQLASREPCFAL